MSLKISQIKDFSSFSKLEVGENFYTVAAMSLTFFSSFFVFFLPWEVATLGQEHLHAYIHCILQRYNKSVCDRISQKPHLYLMFSLIETHFLTTLKYTKSK